MAKFIKAKQVEAVEQKQGKVDGYMIKEVDSEHWMEKKAFLAGHTLIGKDDKK
jgi:hypothetical protein